MLPLRHPYFLLLVGVSAAFLGSLLLGYENYSLAELWDAVTGQRLDFSYIIFELRLPRATMALFIGMSLAISGAALQLLTRNPMAAPDILSLNSAAALAVVFTILIIPTISLAGLALAALIGVCLGVALLLSLLKASGAKQSTIKLPLLGIVLSLFMAALTQAILALDEGTLEQALFWLSGSLVNREADLLLLGLPMITAGLLLLISQLRWFNLLQLDPDHAQSLGLNVSKLSKLLLIAVILMTSGSVIMAGPISFVGLIAPQIIRATQRLSPAQFLIQSAFFGALMLLVADILARFVAFPKETPVGVLTAALGAPILIFFAYKRLIGSSQ